MLLDETIAAIATPLGVGGIGVIRVSGGEVLKIAKTLLKAENIEPFRVYHSWLPGDLDEVVVSYFASPKSFTGEDVLEISCHGSPVVLRRVLAYIFSLGARQAERGEFAKRAFLSGKIDLLQAESILSLISSKTDETAGLAAKQLKGTLSNKIKEISKKVLEILTGLQASIDFPDDVEEPKNIESELSKIIQEIESLLSSAKYGKIISQGITVAIIGKPNVGKSSLLNALLKEDRAIVADLPGTTRDVVEDSINLKGVLVNLMDTAGIREAEGAVEGLGIDRSKGAIKKADMILAVFDGSKPIDEKDKYIISLVAEKPHIKVINKVDLGDVSGLSGARISARSGVGVKELEEALYGQIAGEGLVFSDVVITSERQEDLLRKAKEALNKCVESVKIGMSPDALSIDLQEGYSTLSEILGVGVGDDVLDKVFLEFCVGK